MGTVVPAGGYAWFDETNHFNTGMGSNMTDFALDAAFGDDVWLLRGDAQSNRVAFEDYVAFGAARNGESFGRWPNGLGGFQPMLERTFGASNSGPRVGPVVVSEFMYAPASGDPALEFVEIYNGGTIVENLNDWRLTGDADFAFPSNQIIGPGEVLLVLPFDPDLGGNAGLLSAFRSQYGMGTNQPLVGGFLGSLPDEGGTIRLRRPDSPPLEAPGFVPMLLEDEVLFGAAPPWPSEASGSGPSLMRRGPTAWGNDPGSWTVASIHSATPGVPPTEDADGDNLPDIYELEVYGGTNVVGSAPSGDADGDGHDDEAEYVAGTSATNASSRFELGVGRLPDGNLTLEFQTQPIGEVGYFGLQRTYSLEQSSQLGDAGSWSPVSGFSALPATGSVVTYTNSSTNQSWSARGTVLLETAD
jgi:hypothetical protein